MLMDSMSDPRRANWLALSSSMAEDLCWPEENSTSRPSWELEAEILRLTTRLMIRERELKQSKSQLKSQATRYQQQIADLRWKMDEKEEEMRLLLLQKDSEMQTIVSQLLLFESELRQEQNRIESLLQEKDAMIRRQQLEIQKLREAFAENRDSQTSNGRLVEVPRSRLSRDSVQSLDLTNFKDSAPLTAVQSNGDSAVAVKKLKDGLARIRAIQDLTNVKSPRTDKSVLDVKFENSVNERKRVSSYKAPQKMKDLKAKRINSQKTHRQIASNEFCGQVIL